MYQHEGIPLEIQTTSRDRDNGRFDNLLMYGVLVNFRSLNKVSRPGDSSHEGSGKGHIKPLTAQPGGNCLERYFWIFEELPTS